MSKPTPRPCKLCGAAVYFATHPKSGARAILDSSPTPDGNLLVVYNPARDELTIEQVGGEYPAGRNRYKDHHATCPPWIAQVEAKKTKRKK